MRKQVSFVAAILLTVLAQAAFAAECAEEMTFDANGQFVPTGECESIDASRSDGALDILNLVGQNKKSVERVVGKAESCEKSKYGEKCYYRGGSLEIVFIEGQADWFTVYPSNALYLQDCIEQIGLKSRKPDAQASGSMKWLGLDGLLEVQAFRGSKGYVDYLYVKARTP